MSRGPNLSDGEVVTELFPDSPPVINSPMASPDKNESTEKIEDPELSDEEDSVSIFVNTKRNVSHQSGLKTTSAFNVSDSAASPKGRTDTPRNSLFSYTRPTIPPQNDSYQNSAWFGVSSSKPNMSFKARDSDHHSVDRDPMNIFKVKSKLKPVKFIYESANEKKQSDFCIKENQSLEKAALDCMKMYDKWVSTHLKLTKDVSDYNKLPLIDTSHLTKMFEESKISGQRRQQKGNAKAQATNGRKTKNQNNFVENNGRVSPNEGQWKSRNKEKFEHGSRKSSDNNQIPIKVEEGRNSPYEFTDDETSDGFPAINASKGIIKTEQGRRNFSGVENRKNNTNIDVEFQFNEKIMTEEPEIKPNQSSFSQALKLGSRTDTTHQDRKKPPAQNNETPNKHRDSCDTPESVHRNGRERKTILIEPPKSAPGGRGRGRGSSRQDILNGSRNRDVFDSLQETTQGNQNNQKKNGEDIEEEMPCPICNRSFPMGQEIERHVETCLTQQQMEPVKTRSKDQANASGKKRPKSQIEPEDLILCPYCNNHVQRPTLKEHISKCEPTAESNNIDCQISSDEESDSLIPPKVKKRN